MFKAVFAKTLQTTLEGGLNTHLGYGRWPCPFV